VALNGPVAVVPTCPMLMASRTSRRPVATSEFDPERTSLVLQALVGEKPMSETLSSDLADGMTNSDDDRRLECFVDMTRNLTASSGPLVNLSGFSELRTQQEKAPDDAGAQVRWRDRKINTSGAPRVRPNHRRPSHRRPSRSGSSRAR
jgi:hypothetical protein